MSKYPTKRISEFCTTGSGGTPSRTEFERYYQSGTIPWIKSGELREVLINTAEEYVTAMALKETSIKLVPAGAILLAMYGATVGRLGLLGIEATTNQAVCHIVPNPLIADAKYVFHAISQRVPNLIAMGVGGAQPNINQGIVKNLSIPLPSLITQKRIVAILDLVGTLRAKRREALAQLDKLTQSIFVEMFGDPMAKSSGWPIQSLSHFIAGFESGKSVAADDEDDVSSQYRVLKVSAVTTLEFRASESKAVPRDYKPQASYFVKDGDLIFSRANTTELIGATAFVNETLPNLLLSDKLWRFMWHPIPNADPYFVAYLFRQPAFRAEIGRRASGTSGSMKNISQGKVLSIKCGLPPLLLQQAFATRIKHIEKIKIAARESLAQLDALFASLQHRAFRGEL